MRLGPKRVTLAALSALGALVIHQIAYLLAYPVAAVRADALADHGHLPVQWALVTPLAVVTAAGFVLRQVRNLHVGHQLSPAHVAITSAGFYFVQESIEGGGPVVAATSPTTWIGLVLAPAVAFAISHIVREASELAARFLTTPTPDGRSRSNVPRPATEAPLVGRLVTGTSSRGPPSIHL